MSSILTAVFKATFGVLVNKARDKAAEKLREGDVMDEKIRDLIAREIDDINSKLDGLSRKDLLAAIDAFETGLRYCYQAMDKETGATKTQITEPRQEISEQFSTPSFTGIVNTATLASGIRNLQLTEVGEETKSFLSQGKERFRMAREKATEASNNKNLSLLERITAIRYRVMATMFESAAEVVGTARNSSSVKDVLKIAMPECKECLQKLHCLPGVQSNFNVKLGKGPLNVKGLFEKDERREIISAVCQVNRAIYDALQAAGMFTQWFELPAIDTGEDKIDPLHDGRVATVLQEVDMEHCCITPWSFGQKGEEEHKLRNPVGIATNADGQFIITDKGDKTVKVFDSSGQLILKFSPHTDDDEKTLDNIWDVATDEDGNIYVLVRLVGTGAERSEDTMVVVFNSTADQLRKFPVEESRKLTVSKNKVLVIEWFDGVANRVIHVYKTDGEYVRKFGREIVQNAIDITAGPAGRVLVLDLVPEDIHVFTEDGQHLNKFSVRSKGALYSCVACHPEGEHVIVAGVERTEIDTHGLRVAIYTRDGECQRTVTLNQTVSGFGVHSMKVRMAGHIVVSFEYQSEKRKVIMF